MIFKIQTKSKYAREVASSLMSKYQPPSPEAESRKKTGKEIIDALNEEKVHVKLCISQKKLGQLINLLEHWSEVQHDSPDSSTPSEKYSQRLSDYLRKVSDDHDFNSTLDINSNDAEFALKEFERQSKSSFSSVEEKEVYNKLIDSWYDDLRFLEKLREIDEQ